MSGIKSQDFAKPLIDAGVLPPNLRRMIIDVQSGQPVKVYYDTFGNESLLQMITPQMLMDAEPIVHSSPETK